jgi:hypothetical protein
MLEYHKEIKRRLPDHFGKRKSQPIPCINAKGALCVTESDINHAEYEHFSRLALDSTKVSKDPAFWENLTCEDEPLDCGVIGAKISPQEFLSACSRMNPNAACGMDNIPPNLFKEILKHERGQFVGMLNAALDENTSPDLRRKALLKKLFSDVESPAEIYRGPDGAIAWKWDTKNLLVPVMITSDKLERVKTKAGTFYQPLDHVYHPVPIKDIHTQLVTPAGQYALMIINKSLEEGRPAAADNNNVVVSLSKPNKDPVQLTNRRGITLSTAFNKLTMTILEDRMSQILNEKSFFTEDQGGFRRNEEGISQFLCLAEVVRRRANVGKKTYALFIDFQKAFPSVPHEALWKKLRHLGIPDNVIKFLNSAYENSEFRIRTGSELSKSYSMEVGTKEGCPLSPLLFIIFINDLFKKLPGVLVPGVRTDEGKNFTDKGKLYADDAAAFFDSIEELEQGCRIISEWVIKWQTLKVGHAKCAVVMYGEKDLEKRELFYKTYGAPTPLDGNVEKRHFSLTDGKVYAERSYVYLGIPIGDSLGIDYDEEFIYARSVAQKVKERVGQFTCFLTDKRKPITEKVFLIKTYIFPTALYGGEWFGMNKARTAPIQEQINRALRMVLEIPRKRRNVNFARISWELGIPTVEVACATARHRIFAKAGELKTDARIILTDTHKAGTKQTWSAITHSVVSKATAKITKMTSKSEDIEGPKLEPSMIESLLIQEKLYKKKLPDHIKEERRHLQLLLWHEDFFSKDFEDEHYDYTLGEKCTTRHFKKAELYYPELRAGVLALTKARLGLFPSGEQAYIENEKEGTLTTEALRIGKLGCPLCGESRRSEGWNFIEEIDHLLVQCTSLNELRDEHLSAIIGDLRASSIVRGQDELAQVSSLGLLLIGGMCLPHVRKGIALKTFLKGKDRVERFLYTWRTGFGHLTGIMPENMASYGFVPTARFLQNVLPKYEAAIARTHDAAVRLASAE